MKILASFTFDDGSLSHFTRFLPILDKFGFKGSFYIITDQVGLANKMTWSQIAALYRQGHEIGSHTHTHASLPALSDEKLDFELKASKNKLTPFGATTLSYPFGDYDRRVINFAKKYYAGGRAWGNPADYKKELGINMGSIDKFALKTVDFSSPAGLPKSVTGQYWLIFVIHDPPQVSLDYGLWSLKNRHLGWSDVVNLCRNLFRHADREKDTLQKMTATCEVLKKAGIKVVTVQEGISLFK